MTEAYLGEIRLFAGNYPPRFWAFCEGQILAINNYDALFSLLGNAYGGDGRTSFALPDLRGRVPVHFGTGPGLTPRQIGQRYGRETVTLTVDEIPSHNHPMQGSTSPAESVDPTGRVLATTNQTFYDTTADNDMIPGIVHDYGGSQPHGNIMPSLCIHFIMCIKNGIYPSRN